MRLYFIRHGESEANTLRIISNRDLPHYLTEKGRLQAAILAKNLHGKSIARIYSSPIPRAMETAQILSSVLGAPMESVEALREPDCGVLEGRGDAKAWLEHTYWMQTWLDGQEIDEGPQNGEPLVEIQKRFTKFIESLVVQFGETESEFLLITHGALLLFCLPGILAGVEHQFVLDHAPEYTALLTTEYQNGKLACITWESA